MYSIEDFDKNKTKVLKYILYKKRTENEVRTKFKNDIEEEMLTDIIEYLKECKYIDDIDYIDRAINNYKILKKMSIKEIKYKMLNKGLNKDLIDEYIEKNIDDLTQYEINSAIKILQKLEKEENQKIAYLLRKGYKSDSIKTALEEIK